MDKEFISIAPCLLSHAMRLYRRMSEIPPLEPDPNVPPQQYAAYPRGEDLAPYGSVDKLQALADGYFGLNNVFLVNVVLVLAGRGIQTTAKTPEEAVGMLLAVIAVLFTSILFLSLPHNKKIAYGKGWTDGQAIVASVLMGLNSALCCGIIGYVVMQNIAFTEMKKYGIVGGAFGLKKKLVMERIAQMRAKQGPPQSF